MLHLILQDFQTRRLESRMVFATGEESNGIFVSVSSRPFSDASDRREILSRS